MSLKVNGRSGMIPGLTAPGTSGGPYPGGGGPYPGEAP
ncbi:hypothetical protein I545_4135 [Mycobacterium kansasii 662]|uniref:Uncharacterized protein n=1 Tax=Mycobacterium kansasii 662 TaxID=1299326 RepID=X7ZCM4_MYCKA|nr:hypothetical protein I547_3046 [Mycobacterium kansasii 824]EUA16320.1 hypothetical protein I545_4135 [Mycobacterium kansasii 662]